MSSAPAYGNGVFGGNSAVPKVAGPSTRKLSSIDNLEESPFNPLATGGGPRWTPSEKYRSGLVGIPPK